MRDEIGALVGLLLLLLPIRAAVRYLSLIYGELFALRETTISRLEAVETELQSIRRLLKPVERLAVEQIVDGMAYKKKP